MPRFLLSLTTLERMALTLALTIEPVVAVSLTMVLPMLDSAFPYSNAEAARTWETKTQTRDEMNIFFERFRILNTAKEIDACTKLIHLLSRTQGAESPVAKP